MEQTRRILPNGIKGFEEREGHLGDLEEELNRERINKKLLSKSTWHKGGSKRKNEYNIGPVGGGKYKGAHRRETIRRIVDSKDRLDSG